MSRFSFRRQARYPRPDGDPWDAIRAEVARGVEAYAADGWSRGDIITLITAPLTWRLMDEIARGAIDGRIEKASSS